MSEDLVCCDLHNHHCEPPGDLCCYDCTEAAHPEHRDGTTCVLSEVAALRAALTGVTDLLDEARTERDNATAEAKRLRTENQRLQDQRNELADEVMRYRAELRGMGRAIAGEATS